MADDADLAQRAGRDGIGAAAGDGSGVRSDGAQRQAGAQACTEQGTAHGMGQPSRFLSRSVQSLFSVTGGVKAETGIRPAVLPERRVEVSVNGLFG